VRTKVGDRFVTEEMLQGGYSLGGEPSGHVISLDYNTTGDGPITALHVLYAMKKENASLSELVADIRLYPQVLVNIPLQDKEHPETRKTPKGGRTDFKSHPMIVQVIRDAEERLKGRGRLLVRPSGTEHKIRVMVEADEKRLADTLARRIAEAIKKTMSV